MSQHDIGDVCATVKDGIDELTDATLDEIRRQVPAYRRVPLEEHRRAVRDQHEMRLGVLVTDRPLTPGDLKSAAHLARRRASQGIPIEDLISAYHLGDQELWQRILRVTAPRPSTSPLLATRMLASIHAISQVLAAAHAEVSRAQDEHRVTTSQRLVELLCAAPEPTPEALVLASSLGFRADGGFQSLVWVPNEPEALAGPPLYRALANSRGSTAVGRTRVGVVVVTQGVPAPDVASKLTERLGGSVGIGWERKGLRGAAVSITDAALAVRAATTPGAYALNEHWLAAALLSTRSALDPLLAPLIRLAHNQPRLCEAVEAFHRADMSVTGAAAELGLHPNTVKYRLDRWDLQSGAAVRTVNGLVLSSLACRLSRTGADPSGEDEHLL